MKLLENELEIKNLNKDLYLISMAKLWDTISKSWGVCNNPKTYAKNKF